MTSYGQFCPVAKATEVLGERWTLLVVRELLGGSSRFSELQRGLPGCPPATLAKRLRRLTSAGVVGRVQSLDGHRYELTEASSGTASGTRAPRGSYGTCSTPWPTTAVGSR